jgi:UDP-GlcNAc3NAcA epimerase
MNPIKIATVIGARPQFIKAAVVSRGLKNVSQNEIIIHTGQHFDSNMSDIFFEELDIPKPGYHLGIGGGTHGQNTGRMIEAIEAVLLKEQPTLLLVYGDTDSTLAGAVAAVKLHIPVAHVEAGLRSFNRKMPEEINRILTDHASDLLFTPSAQAGKQLLKEGIKIQKIKQVGDVMYDAAIYYGQKIANDNTTLTKFGLQPKKYALATLHRAENVDDKQKLTSILKGLANYNQTIVWPMHPRTKARLSFFDIQIPANIKIIEPVGYLEMITLEKNAALITTDSGGIQKEAYFHQVPCIKQNGRS